MEPTIYAIATGAGKAAIAIVRISGPSSSLILQRMCPGSSFLDRMATYAPIRDERGLVIDYGVVIWFCGPRSFTGEDSLEFQVTGSRAVVSEIFRTLALIPCTRPAEAGEFARRAFLNGKLDLTEIEGLASLIEAETQAQRRHAMRMASGELSRQCERIREQLLHCIATVESMLDFSDLEETTVMTTDDLTRPLSDIIDTIESLLTHDVTTERLRQGMTVVIAGPPNVGKSTLLNALARRDVAIVSKTPGTTRDAIEVNAEIDGFPVTFVDTAGIRDTSDPVEAAGIARTRARRASADLTLWLKSAIDETSDNLERTEKGAIGPVLYVRTKADLPRSKKLDCNEIAISALTGMGLSTLQSMVAEEARNFFVGAGSIVLHTERQRAAARDAIAALQRIVANPFGGPEIVAEELRLAAHAMARVTGRIAVEEVLGEIFSRFCVGK